MTPGIGSNWKLPPNLIAISEADQWPQAIQEWSLDYIEHLEVGEESETCLCSHYPIREVCHITNHENQNQAIVGNCCVKRFEGETAFAGTHKIFDALKRIEKHEEVSANKELIKYAYQRKIFSESDYEFYLDIWKKRALSEKQEKYKLSLNRKILDHVTHCRKAEKKVQTVSEAFFVLKQSPKKLADRRLVQMAFDQGILKSRDKEFYLGLWDKNVVRPSEKQQKWLDDLNQKMTQRLTV